MIFFIKLDLASFIMNVIWSFTDIPQAKILNNYFKIYVRGKDNIYVLGRITYVCDGYHMYLGNMSWGRISYVWGRITFMSEGRVNCVCVTFMSWGRIAFSLELILFISWSRITCLWRSSVLGKDVCVWKGLHDSEKDNICVWQG